MTEDERAFEMMFQLLHHAIFAKEEEEIADEQQGDYSVPTLANIGNMHQGKCDD